MIGLFKNVQFISKRKTFIHFNLGMQMKINNAEIRYFLFPFHVPGINKNLFS